MAHSTDKVWENRVRRMAERQGLRVIKSRRRDTRALDFGGYWLIGASSKHVVVGGDTGVPLDEIEAWLTGDEEHS